MDLNVKIPLNTKMYIFGPPMFEIGLNNREKVIMYSKEGESNKNTYFVYNNVCIYCSLFRNNMFNVNGSFQVKLHTFEKFSPYRKKG